MDERAERLILDLLMQQVELLNAIRHELKAIRESTEAQAIEDDEPDPFQTLNGPSQLLDRDEVRQRLFKE